MKNISHIHLVKGTLEMFGKGSHIQMNIMNEFDWTNRLPLMFKVDQLDFFATS